MRGAENTFESERNNKTARKNFNFTQSINS
jgi:hypothetical protein